MKCESKYNSDDTNLPTFAVIKCMVNHWKHECCGRHLFVDHLCLISLGKSISIRPQLYYVFPLIAFQATGMENGIYSLLHGQQYPIQAF